MDLDKLFPLIIIVVGLTTLAAIQIHSFIDKRRQLKNDNPDDIPEPDPILKKAEVISKNMHIRRTGSYKNPSHYTAYCITFKLENGEIKEYDVPIEIFENCKLNDKGNLVTINDNFFDFGDGEDI